MHCDRKDEERRSHRRTARPSSRRPRRAPMTLPARRRSTTPARRRTLPVASATRPNVRWAQVFEQAVGNRQGHSRSIVPRSPAPMRGASAGVRAKPRPERPYRAGSYARRADHALRGRGGLPVTDLRKHVPSARHVGIDEVPFVINPVVGAPHARAARQRGRQRLRRARVHARRPRGADASAHRAGHRAHAVGRRGHIARTTS